MCSQFWKTNVRFEIINFEIGYKWNFVKNRKLILSGPKCPKLGIWAQNFGKQCKFEISTFEIGCMLNFVKRLERWYFLAQMAWIWAFGLEIRKTKASGKFQIFGSFLVVSQNFLVVLAGFWAVRVVSARFGWFGVVWPVPGFSKHAFG